MSGPSESKAWKVYEWEDGSHISMLHTPGHRPKFMLEPGKKPSRMQDFAVFTPEPGPPIHLLLQLKDLVNRHFSDQFPEDKEEHYRLQEQKLSGFALDLGVSKNIFFSGLFETGDWGEPSIVRYPKFVPDERLERRVEEAMRMWRASFLWPKDLPPGAGLDGSWRHEISKKEHFLGCVHGMQMRAECDQILVSWDVNGSGKRRTISAYRPKGSKDRRVPGMASDLELVTKKLIDMVLEQEGMVLPESSREQWDQENVLKGKFLIPSPEEVEVFRILDEPLPFFWEDEALVQWLCGKECE